MPDEEKEKPWLKGINDFNLTDEPKITLIYPQRFKKGKCLFVVILPISGLTLEVVEHTGKLHKGRRYPPRIMLYGEDLCLRLLFPLPRLKPIEEKRLLSLAKQFSQWAIPFFDMPMNIMPIEDDVTLRMKFLEP